MFHPRRVSREVRALRACDRHPTSWLIELVSGLIRSIPSISHQSDQIDQHILCLFCCHSLIKSEYAQRVLSHGPPSLRRLVHHVYQLQVSLHLVRLTTPSPLNPSSFTYIHANTNNNNLPAKPLVASHVVDLRGRSVRTPGRSRSTQDPEGDCTLR